jgi:hypothetical protein
VPLKLVPFVASYATTTAATLALLASLVDTLLECLVLVLDRVPCQLLNETQTTMFVDAKVAKKHKKESRRFEPTTQNLAIMTS